MNSQFFSIFASIFKLVTVTRRVFIWKPPFLLTFFTIIILPCSFKPVFAYNTNVIASNEAVVLSREPVFQDAESVHRYVSRVAESRDVGGKYGSEVIDKSRSSSPSLNSKSSKNCDKSRSDNDCLNGDGINGVYERIQWILLVVILFLPAFYAATLRPGKQHNAANT